MSLRVLVRTNASDLIGSGHVARCLTLADALRTLGCSVRFLCEQLPGHMAPHIRQRGYDVALIPPESDSEHEYEAIASYAPLDWVVVDSYAIDYRWESAVRRHASRILVIDDLADRPHDVDLLLDQNEIQGGYARYDGLLPPRCKRLIGARYALIAPSFSQLREKEACVEDGITRILVYFGGADTHRLTLASAKALADFPGTVTVLVGRQNSDLDCIRKLCDGSRTLKFQAPVDDMAPLIQANDLIVGAGGATSWERCVLGKPAIVYTVAENQVPLSRRLAELGAILWLGSHSDFSVEGLVGAVRALAANPHWMRGMARAAHSVTDGLGVGRVTREIIRKPLTLRSAEIGDAGLLLNWRNHPKTRQYSGDSNPIQPEEHYSWMAKLVNDQSRLLLIGEVEGTPLGALRFDVRGNEAYVSIYLDPGRHGEGWGTTLLLEGHDFALSRYPELTRLNATVMAPNHASISAFRKAGYHDESSQFTVELSNARRAAFDP